jgi:selenocysteine lyase/cysteine desulfurase
VSFHGYNAEEDILAVIEALETEVSLLEREEANVKS